jgi:hypothetical protein
MSRTGYAIGHLNPVVYFENSRGEISLPPSTEMAHRIKDRMRNRGWEWREADTLDKIDVLQKRMQEAEHRARERQFEREQTNLADARRSVRERLVARMVSSSTPPYEREFIQHYLMLREEKRAEYKKRFFADQAYFEAREFDASSHHAEEIVDRVPELKDVECIRCHNYRRIKGMKICARCAQEIQQNARS